MRSKTFTHEGRRPFFFYLGDLGARGIGAYPNRQFGVNINTWIASRREIAEFWYEADEYRRSYEKLLRLYLARPRLIRTLGLFVEKKVRGALERLVGESLNLIHRSDRELGALFGVYADTRQSVFRGISIVRRLDTAGLEQLTAWLERQPNLRSVPDAVTALCSTDQLSFLAREEIALLTGLRRLIPPKMLAHLRRLPTRQLLRFCRGHHNLQALLRRLVQRFAWVSRGYHTELPRKKVYFEKEVIRLLKQGKPISTLIRELRQKPQRVRQGQQGFMSRLQPGPRERTLIAILQHAAYLKDLFREHTAKLTHAVAPVFEEIGRRRRVDPNDVRRMGLNEIEALLLRRSKVPSRILALRRNVYLMRWIGHRVAVTYGRRAAILIKRYFEATASDSKEFQGRVASLGKASGRVSVIHGVNDLPKFKRGHVLVVNNTTPDFVPILKRAVAIVAEEGGITAHVSVVSRELGIPCVVGIEGATRIFRNGDRVEVDAYKGIVRRL